MLAEDSDPALSTADIYVVGYPTPKRGGKMNMTDLVSDIKLQIDADGVFTRHQTVIFVAHSMGGLLTEQLLLTYRADELYKKVPGMVFYGVPLEGSKVANLAKFINSDPLIKELEAGDTNTLLHQVDHQWQNAGFQDIKKYCAYEKLPEGPFLVVDQFSATRGCLNPTAIDTTHSNLVKVCSSSESSYRFLKIELDELDKQSKRLPATPPSQPPVNPGNWTQNYGPNGAPPIDELDKAISEVNSIQSEWSNFCLRMQQEIAAPYKYGPLRGQPFPSKLSDENVDRLVDEARSLQDRFKETAKEIAKARTDADNCMNPVPNKIADDQSRYNSASSQLFQSLSTQEVRARTFQSVNSAPLIEYLSNLRQTVGNFHCASQ
jgi:hypothetical protein